MREKTWQELFKRYGEYCVHMGFYECEGAVELEDLYQHFKARLLEDLITDSPGRYGKLIDTEGTGRRGP